MAIQIFCSKCKSTYGLDAKSCLKCGATFGRDKKYRVCVSVKGKRVTRVVDNLTIARETEAAIKGDMVRGEFEINRNEKKTPTLMRYGQNTFLGLRSTKNHGTPIYGITDLHLEPRFGKKSLDAISPIDIERMKTELRKGVNKRGKPFAAATIKHQLVIIRRLYNLARKWNLYDGKNPIDSVSMPKVDNQQTEFLTDEELTRLLDTLDNWPFRDTVAFIKFALFTGLRRGELFKLQWDDVDFERGIITLRDPKSGKTENIPVSMKALDVLKSLDVTSSFVFPGKNGKQRTNFSGPWQRIRKAADLPDGFRFHGLRHHFASTLVSAGVDLFVVQKLLTHKDAKTTARYAHLAPGAIRDAALKKRGTVDPET